MQSRYFLSIKNNLNWESTCDLLLNNEFSGKKRTGFQIEEIGDKFIRGRFIHEIRFVEEIESPLGQSLKINRISYEIINFTYYKELDLIAVVNPGRAIKSFINSVSWALNNEIGVTQIRPNVGKFLDLCDSNNVLVAVTAIFYNKIQVEEGIWCRAEYLSENDVRAHLIRTCKGYDGARGCTIKVKHFDRNITISVFSSGRLFSSENLDRDFESSICESLKISMS